MLEVIQREGGDGTHGSCKPSFVIAKISLSTVFNDGKTELPADTLKRVHVRGESTVMDNHDGTGTVCDQPADRLGIHIESLGIDIGGHRDKTLIQDTGQGPHVGDR